MPDEIEPSAEATVGERLRAAREAEGLSLEDVATRTRIPTRHLESLESSEWSDLPASTYCIGFAKSYATAVGLDRLEIAEALKAEMSGYSPRQSMAPEVFEPADPARVMPRWLVVLAVVALALVVSIFLYLHNRNLSADDSPAAGAPADNTPVGNTAVAASPAPAPAVSGPVVITANDPVWIQVYEKGGATLFQGQLASGQSYEVPATAKAPLLRTGKPEALRIAVGTADAPAVAAPGTTARDVSLLGPDLMRGPAAAAAPPAAAPAR